MINKYIEKIDGEIAALLERESASPTTAGERDLHYLFENRKNAVKWADEKHATAPMAASATIDNPGKHYFGG